MAAHKPFRVLLDNEWQLEDLYRFPHAFQQCYAFIYCFDSALEPRDAARIDEALSTYPWNGGYSYVNLYSVLRAQIPRDDRPKIASIRHSSPGWLDLFLNLEVAIQLAKSVGILLGTAAGAAKACAMIQKTLYGISMQRQRNRLEKARLTQDQIKLLMSMSNDLAKFIGFKSIADLHRRTGNPEVSVKILLAHYRRLKTIVEFQIKNKAKLPKIDDHDG